MTAKPIPTLSLSETSVTTSILARLKQATRAHHGTVERYVTLLDSQLTRVVYRHWLAIFFGFYAPVEARLEGFAVALPSDWPQRRKVPRLHTDLLALGLTAAQIARLPRCHLLPQIDTPSAALGCLYVVITSFFKEPLKAL